MRFLLVICTLLLSAFSLVSANAEGGAVLFVDLNSSEGEWKACRDGIIASNEASGRKDSFYLLHGKVNPTSLEAYVNAILKKGQKIDTIIISGHDGSGLFFGDGKQNRLSYKHLQNIVKKYPSLQTDLFNMALWGCYTATSESCQNMWTNISPSVRTAVGFTLQSPDNTRPANFALMKDYCEKRREIADASQEDELNSIFKNLDSANKMHTSVCTKQTICAREYRDRNTAGGDFCHSFEDLQQRCAEFDPGGALTAEFNQFLAADDDCHANPPQDEGSMYVSSKPEPARLPPIAEGCGPAMSLRDYHGKLHLWRHCAAELVMETGAKMPSPAVAIRLVKFKDFKRNAAKIHQQDLATYSRALAELGLGEYALDDLANLSRKEINRRTIGAVSALTQSGADPKVLAIAKAWDRTLRELDPKCSAFNWVHESGSSSPCVKEAMR